MKRKTKELDVDFIGGQGKSLTKEEQLSISAFIKKMKAKRIKTAKRKTAKLKKQLA
jgi:hypothetical protein